MLVNFLTQMESYVPAEEEEAMEFAQTSAADEDLDAVADFLAQLSDDELLRLNNLVEIKSQPDYASFDF